MFLWDKNLKKEKGLFWTGIFGIAVGLIGIVFYLLNGNAIPPEGKWTKVMAFDLAIGIFAVTFAFLLPYVQISVRQRKWFVYPLIMSFWIGYAIETIQNVRGFDPRFTHAGTSFDAMIGRFFGIQSIVVIVLLVYFMMLVFKQKSNKYPYPVTAVRYACLSIIIAIIAGIWMIVLARMTDSISEMPNQMILHFIGFHGLQAIPIIGWFATYTNLTSDKAKKHIHLGGIAWLVLGISLFVQAVTGHDTFDFTGYLVVAMIAFVVWFYQVVVLFIRFYKQRKQKRSSLEHV